LIKKLINLAILATPLFTVTEYLSVMAGSYVPLPTDLRVKIIKDVILLIIIILFGARVLISGKLKVNKIVLLFTVIALSFALGLVMNGAMFTLISLRVYLPFLLILISLSIYEDKDYETLNKILWGLFIIQIVICFVQILLPTMGGGKAFFGIFHRLIGTFAYPNTLALFLLLVNSIFLFQPRSFKRLIPLSLSCFLIIGTGSGAGILLMCIMFLLYFMLSTKLSAQIKPLLVFVFVFIIGISIIFLPIVSGRADVYSISASKRADYLNETISNANMMQFLFGRGMGVGSNTVGFLANSNILEHNENVFINDSLFTSLFAQMGVLGLGVFIVFNCYIVWLAYRCKYNLGVVFLSIWFCYNLSGSGLEVFPVNWVYMLIVGRVINIRKNLLVDNDFSAKMVTF